MEDTLRVKQKSNEKVRKVLILVLMEDTLRVLAMRSGNQTYSGLNPCFNGRYSQRVSREILEEGSLLS